MAPGQPSSQQLQTFWSESAIVRVPGEEPADPPRRLVHASIRLGAPLWCQGNLSLANHDTVAFICSRTPRHPSPHNRWVRLVPRLLAQQASFPGVIVSSLEAVQYDFVSYVAGSLGRPLILALPGPLPGAMSAGRLQEWLRHYETILDPGSTLLVSTQPSPVSPTPSSADLRRRDVVVDGLADVVVAIDIRQRGSMEQLLSSRLPEGRRLLVVPPGGHGTRGNQVLLERGAQELVPELGELPPEEWKQLIAPRGRPETDAVQWPGAAPQGDTEARESAPLSTADDLDEYLFHYTRARPGPWPDQSRMDYFAELRNGGQYSGHRGRDALERILDHRKIYASSRLIRGGVSVVCFTDRSPAAIRSLTRWSRGQTRWSFEPYAIAVRRRYAVARGVAPVLHLSAGHHAELAREQQFRYQRFEPPECDWTAEGEWRHAGDFDFSDVTPEDLTVITPTAAEALSLRARGDCRVLSLDTILGAAARPAQ
ncbi:MAG: hypothetical protein HYV63_00175 [Candidatus Schekmanbacteria bacterium]|nr:hypothetical protein [Candidatus Schekmanbacteria bacterium]